MIRLWLGLSIVCGLVYGASAAEPVVVGAGSYLRGLPEGAKGPSTPAPRVSKAVAEKLDTNKVPTNKWWSALAWTDKSLPQFPHPLAVQPHELGLRVTYPGSKVTANLSGIFGSMPGGKEDLVLSLGGVAKFPAPLLDGWSDWFVTALYDDGARQLRVSYGHGSPYVFATCTGGPPRVVFAAPPTVWKNDGWAIGLTAGGGRHYGVFCPSAAKWEGTNTAEWTASKGDYFSISLLPDDKAETLALFAKHAHAHVVETRVSWKYDEATQAVTTNYSLHTQPREGSETATLTALYPHQWRYATGPFLPQVYQSIRGPMKLAAGKEFVTRATFPGVLPWLPTTDAVTKQEVRDWLAPDLAAKPETGFRDTYWEGKQLGRIATLAAVADSAGLKEEAKQFRERLRTKLDGWFSATDASGKPKKTGVFAYEPKWGTLIGYPASYGSDDQLNDHHFHYGYFLKAAAEVARHDPDWAANVKQGGLLRLLIEDIAGTQDNRLFPRLRCFDPYAGHSWASGHAMFGDGNNNESSSEAMNAWAGLVLLGEATGDRELRDRGIWLFTTEMTAIEDYWFGVHGDTFPPEYPASVVTMVWGGKGANATWFSGDPQQVHGINWLPITGASLYLGRFPDYCKKNYDALVHEQQAALSKDGGKKSRPTPAAGGDVAWTSWIDVTLMVRSLSDPDDALHQYEAAMKAEAAGKKLPYEAGHTRAALGHWIHTLARLGTVDRRVTADTPLYAVFTTNGRRTHTAYHSGAKARTVTFSDGVKLEVLPSAWGTK